MSDNKKIIEALAAHKEQITNAHSEILAVQLLLMGLLRQVDRNAAENAFEFAAQSAISVSESTGSPQATRSLQIIDQLRESLV